MSDATYTRSKGMAPSGRTVNRLTVKQIFELCKWLEDLQPTFDHNTTKAYLSAKASDYFKLNVTEFNIQGALETAEIRLPSPPKSDYVKMTIMKRAVEHLYKEMGVALPPEWSDL